MQTRLLAGAGSFTEVCWFDGQWYVAWREDSGADRVLRVRQYGQFLGPGRWAGDLMFQLGANGPAFPRMTASGGKLWLAYKGGAPDYAITLRSLSSPDGPVSLGPGYGDDPMALGGDWVALQATSAYAVDKILIDGGALVMNVRTGAPTGLSRILPDGSVRTIDEDRGAIPGYTRPCWAGDAVAVEGAGLYDLVIRNDGLQCRVFDGEDSQTPRLATDGRGTYLLGTWGQAGVRIALIEPMDFTAPAPDPPVPPVPPTPDPPKPPKPPKPDPKTMTAQDLANVLKNFPQDVFLDHYRAYSEQLLPRDRAGEEGISDGAVMLFFPAFYGTAADLLVQRGIPTGAPADVAAKWNAIADVAGAAAVAAYRKATGNPR
jgi:hypothetical protein